MRAGRSNQNLSASPLKPADVRNAEVLRVCQEAWLNIEVDDSKIYNPLEDIPIECQENPELYIVWLMSQPEYFSFVCNEVLGIDILPHQAVMLEVMWKHKFPMLISNRGSGKTWLMAVYCILRMLMLPGRKIALCGSVFRQSKLIFEYIERICKDSYVLKDIVGSGGVRKETDQWRFWLGDSVCSALPIGDGQTIRGQRANDIMTDEFATMRKEVFETVIAGFASVTADPIGNVKFEAARLMAAKLGIELDEADIGISKGMSNQIVIAGTAYYDWNHFAQYWKKWHDFIVSRGDKDKLSQIFSVDSKDIDIADFNHNDYAVIRIPYELIPRGFMDAAQVARSKATVHSGVFDMEFGSVFSSDSKGFFKRTLIESCVTSPNKLFEYPNETVKFYTANLHGNSSSLHVIGVDPASERDRFSVVVLELRQGHRRVVYAWSTKSSEHMELTKTNKNVSMNFYSYCAEEIRRIMDRFPTTRIAIDSQGGGGAVAQALKTQENLKPGQQLLWPTIDYDKPKDTDHYQGLHILDMINFADGKWTSEANHGLRYDMENKLLLFPHIDAVELAIATAGDLASNNMYNTLESCIMEIEDLKTELSTIVVSQTPNGRERWDTPDVKISGSEKGALRKDRYSALVMANMAARQIQATEGPIRQYEATGGFAEIIEKKHRQNPGCDGPDWFKNANAVYDLYGGV